MTESSTEAGKVRRAHPLAISLIARLRAAPHARVLEIGAGTGRNTEALRTAGLEIDAIPDGAPVPAREEYYDGALSTHELLHGTPGTVAAALDAIANVLKPGAPLHATFASTLDARFGKGRRISKHVFAAEIGDEAGVPHVYFTAEELRSLLEANYEVESIQETAADEIVGTWAHREPLRGVVHWFVRGIKKR
ncbi:MAG TPA: methyltransferase domain-containing protein [Candidatus Rubrimentiphilum sp.]|nr:methyltransferase domain-containing protein [Candidatus Rubrimentiphilum sp.]